jgi:hypothetical protein
MMNHLDMTKNVFDYNVFNLSKEEQNKIFNVD